MKVVLFCGGLGTRLREHSDTIPKPLVNIGYRPIVWHLMRYYAHFGHNEFILCLGYRGDLIREYFLNYNECMSNDFVLSAGAKKVELLTRDLDDWRITFVDTGLHSNIGQRLLRVRKYLEQEEVFLANYADALTDLPLDDHLADFNRLNVIASFLAVPTAQSFHGVRSDVSGIVTSFGQMHESDFWVNGGFFLLRREIFDYIQEGDELVEEPFQRLIAARKLGSFVIPASGSKWIHTRTKLPMTAWRVVEIVPGWCGSAEGGGMLKVSLGPVDQPRRLLCIGAHSDDIEIGCGGTVLRLLGESGDWEVTWVVLGANGRRAGEASESAKRFLANASGKNILIKEFRDGFFPYNGSEIKEFFEFLKAQVSPDIIMTHNRQDLHQDHRLVSEMTWSTFRNHMILEYEIVKYDGDFGAPNLFVDLTGAICRQKVRNILDCFASQSDRPWFTEDTFFSILRLRGLESNALEKYAEAFYCRKMVF